MFMGKPKLELCKTSKGNILCLPEESDAVRSSSQSLIRRWSRGREEKEEMEEIRETRGREEEIQKRKAKGR